MFVIQPGQVSFNLLTSLKPTPKKLFALQIWSLVSSLGPWWVANIYSLWLCWDWKHLLYKIFDCIINSGEELRLKRVLRRGLNFSRYVNIFGSIASFFPLEIHVSGKYYTYKVKEAVFIVITSDMSPSFAYVMGIWIMITQLCKFLFEI